MGREAEAIYDSFVFDDTEEEDDGDEAERGRPELDYDVVTAKFSDQFVPKRNVIYDRACFHKRAQVDMNWHSTIPLDAASQKLTTFITPMGRICFRHLPFGYTSAPEIFQRQMSMLLKDHDGVVVTIKDSGLKLNKAKCHFGKTEIQYFGHISAEGMRPDRDKVKAITQMPSPTSVTELKQILGLVNYVGKFLPGLSYELHPITPLLRRESEWLWSGAQEEAFEKLHVLHFGPEYIALGSNDRGRRGRETPGRFVQRLPRTGRRR
ncbi:hypothetical protein JOB18_009516 [Solea senegalensis]|uniref:Uncharacterized protein n=1 Tax=Solea senegalensis TaxID=28829 RepID=A0AAV6RKE5_SOLSE|nr:hypothetical protein JOB18_009516 [Solea senegalensis]